VTPCHLELAGCLERNPLPTRRAPSPSCAKQPRTCLRGRGGGVRGGLGALAARDWPLLRAVGGECPSARCGGVWLGLAQRREAAGPPPSGDQHDRPPDAVAPLPFASLCPFHPPSSKMRRAAVIALVVAVIAIVGVQSAQASEKKKAAVTHKVVRPGPRWEGAASRAVRSGQRGAPRLRKLALANPGPPCRACLLARFSSTSRSMARRRVSAVAPRGAPFELAARRSRGGPPARRVRPPRPNAPPPGPHRGRRRSAAPRFTPPAGRIVIGLFGDIVPKTVRPAAAPRPPLRTAPARRGVRPNHRPPEPRAAPPCAAPPRGRGAARRLPPSPPPPSNHIQQPWSPWSWPGA
jgi:hypothetical protein